MFSAFRTASETNGASEKPHFKTRGIQNKRRFRRSRIRSSLFAGRKLVPAGHTAPPGGSSAVFR